MSLLNKRYNLTLTTSGFNYPHWIQRGTSGCCHWKLAEFPTVISSPQRKCSTEDLKNLEIPLTNVFLKLLGRYFPLDSPMGRNMWQMNSLYIIHFRIPISLSIWIIRENWHIYKCITILVLFIPLYRAIFPFAIFLLPKEFPFIFLVV